MRAMCEKSENSEDRSQEIEFRKQKSEDRIQESGANRKQ
jgi:hypothetical protein